MDLIGSGIRPPLGYEQQVVMFETRAGDWQVRAACRGEDSVHFFAPSYFEKPWEKDAREAIAKAICLRCPVLGDCRDYALRVREGHGIWGGLNEMERRAVLRQQGSREAV